MPLGIGSEEEQKKKQQAQDPYGLAAFAQPAGAGPAAQQGPWAPSVNVTPTVSAGTLRDTSGLQFNADYAQRVNNLDRGIYDAQMARHGAITNAQAQNQRQLLDSAEMQEKARQALLQRMAGSGRLRSSSTANQSTELEGAYSKLQQDLAADLAGRISQAEAGFVNAVNNVALQKEGLYGQQQQEEQARRLAAEQAEQQRIASEQAAAAQRALLEQIAATPAPVINIPAPPSIGYGGSGGGGGAAPPPPPQAQGPNWNAAATPYDQVVSWANQMRKNYGGQRAGFDADVGSLLSRDPNWAGSMMNTMGLHYGGANNVQDVLNWLWSPQTTRRPGHKL